MSLNLAPWVKESCSTIGTGSLLLTGNTTSFISFATAMSNGDKVYYSILDTNGNREAGIGTFDGVNTITRTTVTATLVLGSYDETNPTPLPLSGNSVVICSLNATAFEQVFNNLNFDYGGISSGEVVASGFYISETEAQFYLPFTHVTRPVSITTNVANGFDIFTFTGSDEANVTPVFNGVLSSNKIAVLDIAGLTGKTVGASISLRTNNANSKITVNF